MESAANENSLNSTGCAVQARPYGRRIWGLRCAARERKNLLGQQSAVFLGPETRVIQLVAEEIADGCRLPPVRS